MDTLGIYISVPFCRSKCSYCNFASGVYPASAYERYVERVCDDLRQARSAAKAMGAVLPENVDSIYLGGGTPSILPPELLHRLFAGIRAEFAVASQAEITLECAPGQLEDDVLAEMVCAGVNRVSFGVQSFIDREAAVTGRLHTRDVALGDVERALAAGIPSVNVDLIAGLPHQTASSWRESLETLVGTGVNHASVYMLEVDEDSRLGRELLAGGGRYHAGAVPADDLMADFYLQAIDFLGQQGIGQYEISNFARIGAPSLHNLKYWQRRPYLGVGVDAHSMLRADDGAALRFGVTDDLQIYLDADDRLEVQRIERAQQLEEAWFLGLRLNRGVSVDELKAEFGARAVEEYAGVVADLVGEGLLDESADGGMLRLTLRGRLLSNEVFGRFLPGEPETAEELISIF